MGGKLVVPPGTAVTEPSLLDALDTHRLVRELAKERGEQQRGGWGGGGGGVDGVGGLGWGGGVACLNWLGAARCWAPTHPGPMCPPLRRRPLG
jgi:hypothetical protein